MSDFLITELDDRYELGVVVIDDDVLRLNTPGCQNTGKCCDQNQGDCTNSAVCKCPDCKGTGVEEDVDG